MQLANPSYVAMEQRQRLSRSVLWKVQRKYFEQQGVAAWSRGSVPHHITSSPFIAEAYARVVFGFLRDCDFSLPNDDSDNVPIDCRQPIYVVELGSGSGRFAYLFLKRIIDMCRGTVPKEVRLIYVMTDLAEKNLEHWRRHPRLQPFVEQGRLDFARYDVERDTELQLINSGQKVRPETLQNPLIVISNYLFDSIPQDSFVVKEDQLFETLISTSLPQTGLDEFDPQMLSQARVEYELNPVSEDYYEEPGWNRILSDYKSRFSDTAFLFPTASLRCLKDFYRLGRGRMLFLSADRGCRDDEPQQGSGMPKIAVHGSFSLMVDYQIIGEYCRQLGGQVLHPARPAENLNVSAFMFGESGSNFVETRAAYAEAIEKFGPDDFFTLKEGIAQVYDALSLDQLLAFLRLSCWDFKRFWEYLPALKKHLLDISDIQKQGLREAILKVWDSYLPIGEENDLAFELGTLLLEMDFYSEALEFLQRSIDLYGTAPGTAYNMGVCHYSLGHAQQARAYLDQALDLDPEFAEAKALRKELAPAVMNAERKRQRKRAKRRDSIQVAVTT